MTYKIYIDDLMPSLYVSVSQDLQTPVTSQILGAANLCCVYAEKNLSIGHQRDLRCHLRLTLKQEAKYAKTEIESDLNHNLSLDAVSLVVQQ